MIVTLWLHFSLDFLSTNSAEIGIYMSSQKSPFRRNNQLEASLETLGISLLHKYWSLVLSKNNHFILWTSKVKGEDPLFQQLP